MKKKACKAKARQRGREEMRAEMLAAMEAAFDRAVGNDRHEREDTCNQCENWYLAIEAAAACPA